MTEWRTVQSFRMLPEVQKILDEVPYGQKSDFINSAIVKLLGLKSSPKEAAMKEKPELPINPKIQSPLQNSTEDSKKSTTSSRISSGQEASAKQQSRTKLPDILRKLSKDGQSGGHL